MAWEVYFEEDYEEKPHGSWPTRSKVVVANEGVLFYTYMRPDGWTIRGTITHHDALSEKLLLEDHPELRERVLEACRTRGKVEPQPESMWERAKDAVSSLVSPSYREPAKVRSPAPKQKPNPPIDSWDLDRVREHLDAGWHLERLDVRYRSALIVAVRSRDGAELAKRLIAAGVDVNHPEDNPPLLHACLRGTAETVEALLDAGADSHATDSNGEGPLQRLLMNGVHDETLGIVQALLKRGADPNGHSSKHRSPLGCAAAYGQLEVCRLLLEAGAEINSNNYFGTALVQSGRAEIAELLLAHSAEIDAVDGLGRSALWYACRHSPPDKVRLLLRAGADPKRADKRGVTPQAAAERNSRSEAVLAALAEHS